MILVTFLVGLCFSSVSTAPREKRIIDGTSVPPGTYPFYAAVVEDREINCGGSIIGDRWVLTAAHCIDDDDEITISVGMNSSHAQKYRARPISWYKEFDVSDLLNDIVLLETVRPIEFNAYVQPINLAEDDIEIGRSVITMGYGFTDVAKTKLSNKLLHLKGNVLSPEECNITNTYERVSTICFQAKNTGNVCNGHSGGPLLAKDSSGKLRLYGVLSRAVIDGMEDDENDYCTKKQKNTYTRVMFYCSWIEETTSLAVCCSTECRKRREDKKILDGLMTLDKAAFEEFLKILFQH
ncbi:hypothetical protein QR680_011110 [Steinernema hermaphroditum]|uniref:Peptidase S1 domain-containing protein n=1 Tax=Steinernema hermaphroditum TaxID=289476 RepID=A0AA39IR67_9BILA|nr:hypothetical protein QR680_011110 [Steinernema hermaphroditum]